MALIKGLKEENRELTLQHSKKSVTYIAFMIQALNAAVHSLGTSGDDPKNYGVFTGTNLTSLALNETSYAQSDFINISLSGYTAGDKNVFLVKDGGEINPTAKERRDFIETDWDGETGFTNIGVMEFSFTTPVVNRTGVDMFIYEIGASTCDALTIKINSQTVNVSSGEYGYSGVDTLSTDILETSTESSVFNLSGFLNDATKRSSLSFVSQNIRGVAIDFSDFGIADGDTVSNFTISGGNSLDMVLVGAVSSIPESSSTSILVGLSALAISALPPP